MKLILLLFSCFSIDKLYQEMIPLMPVYRNTIYFQIMVKLIFFKIEIEIDIFKMPVILSINLKNMNESFFRTFFTIFKLITSYQIFNIF